MGKISLKIIIVFLFVLALAGLFLLVIQRQNYKSQIEIKSSVKEVKEEEILTNINAITGLSCENYQRRPLAVMLASDTVARPLSGLGQADIVFEMPVITDGITRLMAVYICESPLEIGSIRSARHDFIPLAQGLDAIYVHWGGSHFALDKLRAGVMDNMDALINPFRAFYRKYNILPPHNGFTSMERLLTAAEKLGYRLESNFEGYPHREIKSPKSEIQEARTIKIDYAYPFNVEWVYNEEANTYQRRRGGSPEMDKNTNQQVEVKNIVVMETASRQIEGQYNDVVIEGQGPLKVYFNGQVMNGLWQKDKDNPAGKLYFLDESGQEIKFLPGKIWVEATEKL